MAVTHNDLANAIRALAMDAVEQAKSGHPGMPMGMADVATVLFTKFMKFDPTQPKWPDRDRFVLSAGHGSMLIYSLLYLTGYAEMTIEQIKRFRQVGSLTPGHPEYGHTAGVETTTGPLGQGIANSVGMAIAERHLAAEFGDSVVNHRTFVIAGDGCLMEGISQEAISLAGHLKLGRLVVYWDDNKISIDGPTSLTTVDDQLARFTASGWHVQSCDGHNPADIERCTNEALKSDRPSLIACRSTIGYGAPTKAGTHKVHGEALGAEEIAGTRTKLNWPHAPFVVPDEILAAWRAAGARSKGEAAAWKKRLDTLDKAKRDDFLRRQEGTLPAGLAPALLAAKKKFAAENLTQPTRKSSQMILETVAAEVPEIVGGSADLTGSNLTLAKAMTVLNSTNYGGRYIHYGIREHGMAAAMNGMATHGGIIPYGGTFLCFTDYLRPSLRLSALMGVRVIYVMTHDSIGQGEDGPTHQPVEHLASLRAMPNVLLLRPADAVETAECWALALANQTGPTVLVLSRQNVPPLRTVHTDENLCGRGAYEISPAQGTAKVSLLATGSEVGVAVDAQKLLQGQGIAARVVSIPSWELLEKQSPADREAVLGGKTLRVAVEAMVPFGWDRLVGPNGHFVGMTGFGASGPGKDVYKHFGITAEAVAATAKAHL